MLGLLAAFSDCEHLEGILGFLPPPATRIQGPGLTPYGRGSECEANGFIMKTEPLFLPVKCVFFCFVMFLDGYQTFIAKEKEVKKKGNS